MIRSMLSPVAQRLRRAQYFGIYRRFKPFTMMAPETFVDNLRLARRIRTLYGCVVECGVWRGGMSAGIATILGPSRKYFLLDSFEGLPPAQPVDGPAAAKWQQARDAPTFYNNCSASPECAREAMNIAGATDFQLVKGWFSDTIPSFRLSEPIALLRLDGDWYDSTIVCLEGLFDQVVPGGLIIVDDYYAWDGCSRAVHDFLSRRAATERIRLLGNVCYLVKDECEQHRTWASSVPQT
jgi:O-methyltransferase